MNESIRNVKRCWFALCLGLLITSPIFAQDDGGVDPLVLPPGAGDVIEDDANAEDEAQNLTPEQIQDLENIRRQEYEITADADIDAGKKALDEKRFEAARDLLVKAERTLVLIAGQPRVQQKLESTQKLLAVTFQKWADQLVLEAAAEASTSKFEDAKRKYTDALRINTDLRPLVVKRIKRIEELEKRAIFEEDTRPDKVDPEKVERDSSIKLLLEQGRVFHRNRRYMDAREKFEQVLIRDPYNREATRNLQVIYEELSNDAKERRWAMIAERAAEIEWKWVDPVAPLDRPATPVEVSRRDKRQDDEEGIRYKLQNIIIPKISFEEATIQTVIRFLKERSKDLDIEGEGVNIFLRLPTGPAQVDTVAESAPAEEEFSFDPVTPADGGGFDFEETDLTDVGAPADNTSNTPVASQLTITMDFDNIPLGEAIRYICQGAGLKHRIEPFAVIIADPTVALQEMETRFYPIDAGVLNTAVTKSVGGFQDDDDDDDDSDVEDPSEFFGRLGVQFPEGARVSHDPRTSKLIVFNTPENLRKVEEILKELNIQPTQVTIEAKFVEVRVTTLNQLGFKWVFEGQNNNGTLGDYNTNFLGADLTFFAQPDANGSTMGAGINTGIGGTSKSSILGVQSILNDLQFKTLIWALDQSDGNDLLSAPKVTTISGVTAVIDFVQERRFPESFTEPEITTSTGGQVSISPSTPEFGESEEIGVIFRVTPQVAADGYSIDLELEPIVREFIGFDTTFNTEAVINGENGSTSVPFRFDTPIFERRSVETRVIVWDGETVVLGGTIRDSISKLDDSIPYLSDVPFIGRLFEMKGELSEKRNLLVFVTARLVNPAGLPIRPQDIRGLPDFRR